MKAQLTTPRNFFSKLSGEYMRPFVGKDGNTYTIVMNGGKPQKVKITANAALRYDEWKTIDDAVIRVKRNRLTGISDLRANGLVFPLNNGMATTQLLYEKVSDNLVAKLSINPDDMTDNDNPDHSQHYLPIPINHSDFSIGQRLLEESRVRGNGLDTSQAEAATRRVMEQSEDCLFGTESPFTDAGNPLYTYLTHPDVNEIAYDTTTVHWDTATPAQILANVLEMKKASIDDNHYGPWKLYIPTNYDTVMDEDYRDGSSSSSTQTIRQRLEAVNGIQGITVADRLPEDVVLLVQMTSDVVDLVDGMAMQVVQWKEGNWRNNFQVMTIEVPRIKSDYDGKSGIVVLADSSFK